MENSERPENIDSVISYAKSLPDFPNKAIIVQRLETRNLNRYQEALQNLNETLAAPQPPLPGANGEAVTLDQLQTLATRISHLEANDLVAE